jgi:hypothetical protein
MKNFEVSRVTCETFLEGLKDYLANKTSFGGTPSQRSILDKILTEISENLFLEVDPEAIDEGTLLWALYNHGEKVTLMKELEKEVLFV